MVKETKRTDCFETALTNTPDFVTLLYIRGATTTIIYYYVG